MNPSIEQILDMKWTGPLFFDEFSTWHIYTTDEIEEGVFYCDGVPSFLLCHPITWTNYKNGILRGTSYRVHKVLGLNKYKDLIANDLWED